MLDTTKILDDYRRIRHIQRGLASLPIKKIPKGAIQSEARILGLMEHGRIGSRIPMDVALQRLAAPGENRQGRDTA